MTKKDNSQPTDFRLQPKSNVVDMSLLEQKVKDASDELRKETNEIKRQYIEIFGIFAAIITFLGIEVQAFNKINSFSKLIGFSFVLLSSVLFMVFAIERISNSESQRFYKSPIFLISLSFLALAFCFFWYQVSGKVLFWSIG